MYGKKTKIFISEDTLRETNERQDARFAAHLKNSTFTEFMIDERENDIRTLRIALQGALDELKTYESKPSRLFWKK